MSEQMQTPVRRPWCVWLAVGLVIVGACLNALYLFNHSPIDLAEDESHYWEWSRHLDYGYYSKPPGIAWVIYAAVKVGTAAGLAGDRSGPAMMPLIRMPAILFACLSGLVSLFLARRMFRDDRVALAVTLLSGAVPMFAIGSLLITIDSPMYLSWAATVYCLWRAVEAKRGNAQDNGGGGRSVLWLYTAGLACAVGMLFKPVLIAIPLCAGIAAYLDPAVRRTVKTWHAAGAFFLVIVSQVPVALWNAHHGWVTLKHLGAQGGLTATLREFNPLASVGQYVGGQAAGLGGLMFFLLVMAIITAIGVMRRQGRENRPVEGPRPYPFLLAFTLPLWLFYLLLSCWKGTQVNWPAASYFAGMILVGGVVVQGISSADLRTRKRWRGWAGATIIWGFVLTCVAMNLHRLYPLAARRLEPFLGTVDYLKSAWFPGGGWDPALKKLRAFQERAQIVQGARDKLRRETGQEPLIITGRYDTSSSLAFYLPGQPFVYCLMSSVDRGNQYDLWPGPNQIGADGKLAFARRPALIVGTFDKKATDQILRPAFERLEGPDMLAVWYRGILVHELVVYRGYGFKGFPEVKAGNY